MEGLQTHIPFTHSAYNPRASSCWELCDKDTQGVPSCEGDTELCAGALGALGLERGPHGFQKESVNHLKSCAYSLGGDEGPLFSPDSKKGSVT